MNDAASSPSAHVKGAVTNDVPVLAIDGPSGAGKGTISTMVANRLGWHLLDSGALYRAVGHAAGVAGIDLADAEAVTMATRKLEIAFRPDPDGGPSRVFIDGVDVGDALRTEACGAQASIVARHGGVRQALLDKQRDMRRAPGLVADGRDMGTVVFPNAPFKVFLTASAEERARRRHKQLKEKGIDITLDEVLSKIRARDERDMSRADAPLKPADDAVVVDTTTLPIDQAAMHVLALVSASE